MIGTDDPDRWRQIDALFESALGCPAEERDAHLAQRCGDDTELRKAVERLLMIDQRARSFLEDPLRFVDRAQDSREAGTRIGPYELRRRLGSGGMGSVYLAIRADGQFDQQVAIKLIRPGVDGGELDRRLRIERELLARLEHPNIARLYDGGTAEDGRPYLVMELVDGRPITEHCQRQRSSVEEILHLFLQVGDAVAYAHRNLVVHRDLKPANVLVTEGGTAKLLDFGIAKLLEPDPLGAAERTRTGLRPMTPRYASPEQVTGKPISTATDVYALGVLLYRLLTGRMPYRLTSESPLAVEQAIRDQEPTRPSAAVAPDGPIRPRRLRGDLDTILLKALRKEPNQRYESVEQMVADVRRHLDQRPILARAPTWRYRTRKLVRRNRLATSVIALALAGGIVFTAALEVQVRRTTQQRDKAELALDFLVDLFGSAGPSEALPNARELLESGVERAERELAGQPELQSAVLERVIGVYINLSRYQRASELAERMLELRLEVHGAGHPAVWQARSFVAELKMIGGDLEGARTLYEELLAEAIAKHGATGDDAVATRFALALVLQQAGAYEDALRINQENLWIRRRRRGGGPSLGWLHAVVGGSLNGVGRYAEAERAYEQALPLVKERYGARHHFVAQVLGNSSLVLIHQGRFAEAEARLLEAQRIQAATLDERHRDRGYNWINLGSAYHGLGDLEAAEAALERGISILKQKLGPSHRGVASGLVELAAVRFDRGDAESAEGLYREALDVYHQSGQDQHPSAGEALVDLGLLLAARGRPAEAEELVQEGLAVLETRLGPDHPKVEKARRQVDEAMAGGLDGPLAAAPRRASQGSV